MVKSLLFIIGMLVFSPLDLQSQQLKEWFIDTSDKALDVSNFLATRAGFLPVPTIITEPAVGYGLGLGLIFFHRSEEERETGKYLPFPKGISVVGGLVTENGTWGTFLAHQGSWKNDKLRYIGFVGWVDVNLSYYGRDFLQQEKSIGFNLNGLPFYQELMYRVSNTNFFIGGQYIFFTNTASFKSDRPLIPVEYEGQYTTAGIGAQVVFDSRDNIFTTNKGIRSELNYSHYAPYFGGDRYYNTFKSRNIGYLPLGPKTNFGIKLDGQFSFGDIPFYAKPMVILRGVPLMRYQNNMAFVVDAEIRQDVLRRWSITAFVGSGAAVPYKNWQDNFNANWSVGGGFRYFLARMYNMQAGIDVARGPEDWAWYVVVGSYWGR